MNTAERNARREAIKTILDNHSPIYDQSFFVSKLKSEYYIDSIQSTVSRDLRQLGIKKEKTNGQYVLADTEEKEKKAEKLHDILLKSNSEYHGRDYVPYIFQCDPVYAPAVCQSLEEFFNQGDGPEIRAVSGPTGTVCLFVPHGQKENIGEFLEEYFGNI